MRFAVAFYHGVKLLPIVLCDFRVDVSRVDNRSQKVSLVRVPFHKLSDRAAKSFNRVGPSETIFTQRFVSHDHALRQPYHQLTSDRGNIRKKTVAKE